MVLCVCLNVSSRLELPCLARKSGISLYNQLPRLVDQSSHSFHDPLYPFESHHLHVLPATDLHQIMLPAHPSTAHASEQHPPQTRSRGCSAHSKGLRTKCPGGKKQKGNEDERVHQEMIIKTHENPTTEYIHVRARRGQATDSHSLAERVRREKISERMRTLQGLIPGCDKVTGKALMLDQIISYIQSLQSQVQYLSMKLASVSPIHDTETGHDQTMKQPDICNQRDNTTHPTMAATASTFTETNSYDHHLESSNLLQQVQRLFCQDGSDGVVSWDVDDQIQTVIDFNSSELSNTLCNPY